MTTPVLAAAAKPPRTSRIESIDVLRGIVMILMAIDHVRDFFGAAGNPTDPATASAALFFTRWITHLCAPVFFLLTGTAAALRRRERSAGEMSRFLFTRGLWLIVLELTVVRCLGYQFNADYRVTMLVILWALGWSMIGLAALVYLQPRTIVIVGGVMVATHNLADGVTAASLGALGPVWTVLHVQGIVFATSRFLVFAAYPLIPWMGVTALGYGLGRAYEWQTDDRRVFLRRLGLVLTGAFVVLRASNLYGDPTPWTTQATTMRTVLSFLNANKYPPSLLFLLMTLGPALIMLSALEGSTPRWRNPVLVLGRVPLFYFLLHLPFIHALAVVFCWAQYGQAHWMFESPTLASYPFTRPPGWGYSLPVVYAIWGFVVVALFPICLWFSGVKQRRRDSWLQYL
ncbi:MAG TPA: heparan-alpha-glucosaminide N-acetyltransferase domain-containing protein [Vicinamibacterales bacterium]|jgi:uncharacterized membrane protein